MDISLSRWDGDLGGPFIPWTDLERLNGKLRSSRLCHGERLLLQTNRDAPNYALFEVDVTRLEREAWRLVLPERPERVLDAVRLARAMALRVERRRPRRLARERLALSGGGTPPGQPPRRRRSTSPLQVGRRPSGRRPALHTLDETH